MDGERDRENRARLTDVLVTTLFANIRWLGPTLLVLAFITGGTAFLGAFSWVTHKSDLKSHMDTEERRINQLEVRLGQELDEAEGRAREERERMWQYVQTLEAEGRTMGAAWQERIKRDILRELRDESTPP